MRAAVPTLLALCLAASLPGCCFSGFMSAEDAERYHPEMAEVTEVALAHARGHQPLVDILGELRRVVRTDLPGAVGFGAGRDDHYQPMWTVNFFAEGASGSLNGVVYVRQREGVYVAVGIDLMLDGGAASAGETPDLTNPASDGHGGGSGGGD